MTPPEIRSGFRRWGPILGSIPVGEPCLGWGPGVQMGVQMIRRQSALVDSNDGESRCLPQEILHHAGFPMYRETPDKREVGSSTLSRPINELGPLRGAFLMLIQSDFQSAAEGVDDWLMLLSKDSRRGALVLSGY
jgi:hypothetical protein